MNLQSIIELSLKWKKNGTVSNLAKPWEEDFGWCKHLLRRECPITWSLLETCFSADRRLQDFATNIPLHMIVLDSVQVHARTFLPRLSTYVMPLVDLFYNGCLKNGQKYGWFSIKKITERRKRAKNIEWTNHAYVFLDKGWTCASPYHSERLCNI